MSKLMIALFISAGLGFAVPGAAQMTSPMAPMTPMTKDAYKAATTNADAQYKLNKEACSTFSGNAKDICVAEAKGKDHVAKADAEAAYENTPKARENARVAHAQAAYDVANEKCDDLAGNAKDVCVKEAKAALVKGKADAKVDRVTADTRQEAATQQAAARTERPPTSATRTTRSRSRSATRWRARRRMAALPRPGASSASRKFDRQVSAGWRDPIVIAASPRARC